LRVAVTVMVSAEASWSGIGSSARATLAPAISNKEESIPRRLTENMT
jgi:hypothetical protein